MSRRSDSASMQSAKFSKQSRAARKGIRSKKGAGNELSSSLTHKIHEKPRSNRKRGGRTRAPVRHSESDSSDDEDNIDSENDSGGEADGSEDDNDDDVEEPEAFAPSDLVARKRGHQTGLSLTLSNTILDPDSKRSNGRKRKMSNDGDVKKQASFRPTKKLKQVIQEASAILSSSDDDEVYNAVNDISESETDELGILKFETRSITGTWNDVGVAPRGRSHSVDSWAGFSLDETHAAEETLFFDDHFARTEPNSDIDFFSSEGVHDSRASVNDAPSKRRVRFTGIPSTSSNTSTESEIDNDHYVALLDFENQSRSLPLVETETGTRYPSDDSGSDFWPSDSQNDDLPPPSFRIPAVGNDSDHTGSGYESDSDSGMTTDEDIVVPTTVSKPQDLLQVRRTSPGLESSQSTRVTRRPYRRVSGGRGNRMAQWTVTTERPIVFVDSKNKKHVVHVKEKFPSLPQSGTPHGGYDSSPRAAFISLNNGRHWERKKELYVPVTDDPAEDPTPSHDLGFVVDFGVSDATFNGLLPSIPAEEFFGLGEFTDDITEVDEDFDEDISEESLLSLGEFFIFPDEDSDDQDDAEDNEDAEPTDGATTGESSPTLPFAPLSSQALPKIVPKQPGRHSRSSSMLEHLDRTPVSAFRRNQQRLQNYISRPLPTSNNMLTNRGGRQRAASSPISPIRKRRFNRTLGQINAPFTGVNNGGLSNNIV